MAFVETEQFGKLATHVTAFASREDNRLAFEIAEMHDAVVAGLGLAPAENQVVETGFVDYIDPIAAARDALI